MVVVPLYIAQNTHTRSPPFPCAQSLAQGDADRIAVGGWAGVDAGGGVPAQAGQSVHGAGHHGHHPRARAALGTGAQVTQVLRREVGAPHSKHALHHLPPQQRTFCASVQCHLMGALLPGHLHHVKLASSSPPPPKYPEHFYFFLLLYNRL